METLTVLVDEKRKKMRNFLGEILLEIAQIL